MVESYSDPDELQDFILDEYQPEFEGIEKELTTSQRAKIFQDAIDILDDNGEVTEEEIEDLTKQMKYLDGYRF